MSLDIDALLLDRVFQPAADRLAGLTNCFGLARVALFGSLFLQTAVLAWDLHLLGDPAQLGLVVLGTLAEYAAASAVQGQIRRTERQARPGMMNIARITLRPFRLGWIGLATAGAAFWLTSAFRPVDFCAFAVSLFWLLTVYFMCCIAAPPPARAARDWNFAFSPAGAR